MNEIKQFVKFVGRHFINFLTPIIVLWGIFSIIFCPLFFAFWLSQKLGMVTGFTITIVLEILVASTVHFAFIKLRIRHLQKQLEEIESNP
jgi:uncharacterized membrane protein YjjP (DUF1212 family)